MESLTIEGSAPANSESDWGVCEGAGTGDYTGEPITQPSKGPSLVMVHDSLWPEEDNSETKQEEFRCTVHHERGRCSKGICNEYKAFLKKNKLKGGVVEKERSPADRGPWRSRGQSRDSAASGACSRFSLVPVFGPCFVVMGVSIDLSVFRRCVFRQSSR
ncbi:hypothetical protein SCP_0305580 [Sparassis crispa]|uniref:Uncharacterized protein n=1 Tax=Sparassis crispa TaxID=139825 RepID=A0A401GF78_9APHY|nr:hypothetical protein SCP_0305580 [Sparassis crispa]GBE80838.1 hypothetical protein SCP_0305580 [Sparassis crispa]